MKTARELNRLRSNIASKCIEKFTADATADPSSLIDFLHNYTHSIYPIDEFRDKIRELIYEGNFIQFGAYFNSLSLDDLSQINNLELLEIEGLAVVSMVSGLPQQAAREEVAVTTPQQEALSLTLNNLLLAFQLPKTFVLYQRLDQNKKSQFSTIGIDSTSARNYEPSDCQKRLLGNVRDLLLPEVQRKKHFFLPSDIIHDLRQRLIDIISSDGTEITRERFDKTVAPICSSLQGYLFEENRRVKNAERIIKLAGQQGLRVEEIVENPAKGANPSFTAMVNGTKHYIKTCSDDVVLPSNGKVDPNELFVYKVMEYMNFGPKTTFLFGKYSSDTGRSDVSRGNYIMTEDLNQNGNRLLLDLEGNKEAFEQALTDQDFTIELSAASALNDILSLTDTFGRNTRNYGLVERIDGSKTIQFIDHLPNANNSLFSLIDFDPVTYSPRDSLQKRSNHFKADEYSSFKQLETNRSLFHRLIIQRNVDTRLAPLSDAIALAESDVWELIRIYSENFVEGAAIRMSSYIEKITRNKAIYEKTLPQSGQECL